MCGSIDHKLISEQIWPKIYTVDLITIDLKSDTSISDLLKPQIERKKLSKHGTTNFRSGFSVNSITSDTKAAQDKVAAAAKKPTASRMESLTEYETRLYKLMEYFNVAEFQRAERPLKMMAKDFKDSKIWHLAFNFGVLCLFSQNHEKAELVFKNIACQFIDKDDEFLGFWAIHNLMYSRLCRDGPVSDIIELLSFLGKIKMWWTEESD